MLPVAVVAYTLTGMLSPTLVDYMSQTHKSDALALLPVMANALGMALMQRFVHCFISAPPTTEPKKPVKSLWWDERAIKIALLDLFSASLVTIGLVNVGTATYTVIYSSTVSWTALLSWHRKTSATLSRKQWLGVALVTVGLGLNGIGHAREDEGRSNADWLAFALASLLLLLGTVLHALVIIHMEEYGKATRNDHRPNLVALASQMGQIEFVILLAWNVLRLLVFAGRGEDMEAAATTRTVRMLFYYLLLAGNHLLHSLAFFYIIQRLGAVSTAILKGLLALGTFGLAALVFCSERNPNQCLTPVKSLSMLSVFAGGIIYGLGKIVQPTLPV